MVGPAFFNLKFTVPFQIHLDDSLDTLDVTLFQKLI